MSDAFDSLPSERRTGLGTGFILIVTVGVCAVAAIAWAVAAFLHEGGIRICPDGGDEIWSRPSFGSYAPEAIIGLAAVGLLFTVLRGAVATRWAAVLALASVGSLIGYLTSTSTSAMSTFRLTTGAGTAIRVWGCPGMSLRRSPSYTCWCSFCGALGSGFSLAPPEHRGRCSHAAYATNLQRRSTTTAPPAGGSPKWTP
jgi:hypothetical protein